ncbi:hypothetical protein Ocin01_02377 [Orchesella cincta]|uniref:Uncharacterized protein n=1 Tax=Orchesella cincta TaxID=48709 RepID=A0A1D2NGF1_ORCCI|nr:hypothetical protein Ocin01_02377 [Orchesella cincta]
MTENRRSGLVYRCDVRRIVQLTNHKKFAETTPFVDGKCITHRPGIFSTTSQARVNVIKRKVAYELRMTSISLPGSSDVVTHGRGRPQDPHQRNSIPHLNHSFSLSS